MSVFGDSLFSGAFVQLYKQDCVFVLALNNGENRFSLPVLKELTEALDIVEK